MDALASLGSLITTAAPAIGAVGTVAGTGANIFNGIQNFQSQQRQANAQKYIQSLTQNPTKLAAAQSAYTAPLTAGLTDELQNQVQGTLAEKGLGSSPSAYTQSIVQAEAPYIQNNQANGLQALMSALGLDSSSSRATAAPPQDMSKVLAQLNQQNPAQDTADVDAFTSGFNFTPE